MSFEIDVAAIQCRSNKQCNNYFINYFVFYQAMSLLTRPSVVFAIVFGCFAVLIPRIFLPLFRSKPSVPSPNFDDRKAYFLIQIY